MNSEFFNLNQLNECFQLSPRFLFGIAPTPNKRAEPVLRQAPPD
jgi:hypothetical protein